MRQHPYGITYFSLLFCLGAGLAALLSPGEGLLYSCAGISALAAVSLCLPHLLKGRCALPLALALPFLGATSQFCAQIAGPPFIPPFISGAGAAASAYIREIFEPECASIICALLCGDRGGLSSEVKAAFRDSGASHLLALSGMHLGIIYGALKFVFAILGKSRSAARVRSLLVCLCCTLYTLATGASPSLVRALLFVYLGEYGRLHPERSHRLSDIWSGALCLQLVFAPQNISSLGFQLSYLAVLGIATIHPLLSGLFPASKGRRGIMARIWNVASLSISCQCATAGLVYLRFGTLPGHFLLTNLMAIPLTTLLVSCSLATLALSILGLCPEITKKLCEMLAEALLKVMIIVSGM